MKSFRIKFIGGLVSLLMLGMLFVTVPANANAPVSNAVVAAKAKVTCGKVKKLSMDRKINKNASSKLKIHYKVCKDSRLALKWVRSVSLTASYDYLSGDYTPCGYADPFDGFRWRLWFNDLEGRNFSKKIEIDCEKDTEGTKTISLSNTPRLYCVETSWPGGGRPKVHGEVGMRMSFAPDEPFTRNISNVFRCSV